MRDLIETELLNTIEWSSKEKLTEIRAHDKALEQLLNAGNRAEWWKRHREFQESIFNLSPDKIIVREALRLWSLTDRYRALAPVPRRPSAERDIVNRTDIIHALAQKDMPILLRARAKRRNAFKIQVLEILMDRGL
ncbi:MAG: FCD domain-containing protein [Sphingomonadales bacterium]|nr:MAG: FCD domain-containing protein [Sphingomonadales bacterium]TNF03519.1 MAG: FCD domain-containing protein [Sphingomonadales bacterium]